MITLIIILTLLFVPGARRIILRTVGSVLALFGIIFLIARPPSARSRGL
jgi:hypothetical protein